MLKRMTLTMAGGLMAVGLMTATSPAFAAAKNFTGEVGDAMCGLHHMSGDPVECTRGCVKDGSDYALIVGDKVLTLKVADAKVKAELFDLAGKKATVTGEEKGDTIQVTAVHPAK
ncbi:MAG TPA: hypothetical protein VNE16_00395 [Vicinamibacterales bacterium]|nr:hypothetical protein [Vicinamibacterales bacterium]